MVVGKTNNSQTTPAPQTAETIDKATQSLALGRDTPAES